MFRLALTYQKKEGKKLCSKCDLQKIQETESFEPSECFREPSVWWGDTDVQPVIMLHGWQDNAGTFDTLVPLLRNASLLALEMAGHGHSSHYPLGQSYGYGDGIVDLRRVVTHFGWSKISLVGHSLGSMIAFGYAAAFPDGVERFVSLDCIRGALLPTLLPASRHIRSVIEANLSYERKMSDEASRPEYTYDEVVDLYWKGCEGSVTRESAEVILRRGVVATSPDRFRLSRDVRVKALSWAGVCEASVEAMAAATTCDVLCLRATESFTSSPEARATYERSMGATERCEYHEVEGTHHVHLNHPERVAPLINAFFEGGDEGVVY